MERINENIIKLIDDLVDDSDELFNKIRSEEQRKQTLDYMISEVDALKEFLIQKRIELNNSQSSL